MIRKLTLGLTVILSSFAANSYAFPGQSPANVSVPCYNGGFTFGLAGMYLHPSTDLDFGVLFPAEVSRNGVNVSRTATNVDLDTNYRWAYSASVGYIFPCSANDLTVTYSNFNHGYTRSFEPKDQIFINNILFTPLTDEHDLDVNHADAKARINYQTVDLDFGQHLNVGCNTHLRLIAGLRYASLESKFHTGIGATDAEATPVSNVLIESDQQSRFHGAGPRVGAEFQYALGNGFGVMGQATSALLVGEYKNSITGHVLISDVDGVVSNDQLTLNRSQHTRVVPNFNGKLGLNYNYQFCNPTRTSLTLEAGYQVDYFLNAGDKLNALDAFGFDAKKSIDTSFSGPFVGVKVRL